MRARVWGPWLAALALLLAGCSSEPQADAEPVDQAAKARQQERLDRLRERHSDRVRVLGEVSEQRRDALAELARIERVRGKSAEAIEHARYGSDGTGDPEGWVQSGASATKAPNSTPQAIAQFEQARASGRIRLTGAAKVAEITGGLIDDRVLRLLTALSAKHRLEVNSLRVSHPRHVQDDLGTPTESNHVYGRSADISAVDGYQCITETRKAPYRTLLDNPPPEQPGPCLALALEIALTAGELTPGEIIYYWRVPGPVGVSLPNHDDHIHVGWRSYPNTDPAAGRDERSHAQSAPPSDRAESEPAPEVQDPDPADGAQAPAPGAVDRGEDLQLPKPGEPTTIEPE